MNEIRLDLGLNAIADLNKQRRTLTLTHSF